MPIFSRVKLLGIVLCLIISMDSFSQRKKSAILEYDTTFYKGNVVLTDGAELDGKIAFNDKEGIVTLLKGKNSRSFNSRNLLKFEFYSDDLQRNRLFYSLEYNDLASGIKDVVFFEVLGEFDSFAVLSKMDRVKTEARRGPLGPAQSPLMVERESRKFIHSETIFFVSNQGDFEPYLKMFEKEIDGHLMDINEHHERYLEKDLFEKYVGNTYSALAEYARENKLSFKKKEHIVTILNEYRRLTLGSN